MAVVLKNSAGSSLLVAAAAADTEIQVLAGDASKFPVLEAGGDWFPIRLRDSAGNSEYLHCTARDGNRLTVQRAREDTTARDFPAGASVHLVTTAAAWDEMSSGAAAEGAAAALAVTGPRLDAIEAALLEKLNNPFVAAWDFIVGSGPGAAIKKTLAEVKDAFAGLVGAYTRQQFAVPVVLTGQSGIITLDADIHQDVSISATGAITLAAPANPVFGKTIFLTLYAGSALTIIWNSIFKANADTPLDTAFVPGKRVFLQFRYVANLGWVLMGRAQEA